MNMWQSLTISIVAAIIVASLIGTAKVLAPRVRARWSTRRGQRSAAAQARTAAWEQQRRERDRQAGIEAARAQGRVIAVGHRGQCPVEVTFSDQTTSYYFNGDRAAYRTAMNSGEYPPARTFHTAPPSID